MGYGIAVLMGYLMGSSNMAYWLSKIKKVDIRSKGTGNLGASNATVLLGWGSGRDRSGARYWQGVSGSASGQMAVA